MKRCREKGEGEIRLFAKSGKKWASWTQRKRGSRSVKTNGVWQVKTARLKNERKDYEEEMEGETGKENLIETSVERLMQKNPGHQSMTTGGNTARYQGKKPQWS